MPKTAAFTNFPSAVSGAFDKGRYFYKKGSDGETIFFPTFGIRDTYDMYGTFYAVNYRGIYWTAGAYNTNYAISLFIEPGSIDPSQPWARSYGFSVRPVAE